MEEIKEGISKGKHGMEKSKEESKQGKVELMKQGSKKKNKEGSKKGS